MRQKLESEYINESLSSFLPFLLITIFNSYSRTQESEETEKKVSGTPTSLSLSSSGSYSESLEDEEEEEDEDEEGKEGEHGEEEDEDENEDEMKSPSSVDSACTLPRDSVVHVDPFFLIGDAENEEGYPFRETFNQQKEQSTANIRRIMFDGEVWVEYFLILLQYLG